MGVQQVGAHVVHVGAGVAQELQPPWAKMPWLTGLMTERFDPGVWAAASSGIVPTIATAIQSDFILSPSVKFCLVADQRPACQQRRVTRSLDLAYLLRLLQHIDQAQPA